MAQLRHLILIRALSLHTLSGRDLKICFLFAPFFFFGGGRGACSITDNLAEGKSWLGLHPHHGKLGGMDDWPHKQVKQPPKL